MDHDLINSLFAEHGFDYVYHLAAYAAEGLSHFIRRFNYNNNLVGSINLIDAAVNYDVKCFVFTSSIAVYGAGQTPLTESQTPSRGPVRGREVAVEQDLKAATTCSASITRLPPAQRLRRAAEHRRPVPQRDRDLHEPDPQGRADDRLRGRAADPGVLVRRTTSPR